MEPYIGVVLMKSKIAFILFLIGCAGVDGNFTVSALMIMISLFFLWKESKKIDVPTDQSRNVYK